MSGLRFTVLMAAGWFARCPGLHGQEAHPRGAIVVELAGNSALGATVNAELHFDHRFGGRIGAGLDFYTQTKVLPVQAVMLLGSGHSKLELAAGITLAHEAHGGDWHWDGTKVFFSGFLGYRHQVPKGFLFRAGVIPLLWTNAKLPWIAIGFGTTF